MTQQEVQQLEKDLRDCWQADYFRLRAKLNRLKKQAHQKQLTQLQQAILESKRFKEQRSRQTPELNYPSELPVSERRAEIAEAIQQHQVILVCGETGSGKTTQLPKICLQAGRGINGIIGHTQPRRIAAQAISNRLAEELKTEVGKTIGFKVRFHDRSSPENLIKVMTDGILLAELQQDHWLNQYDTLIIDEAHERSLNIDFLLGYLKQLLKKRKDLKLIITSATIDAERIAAHFDNAPIVEVSGRTYPVEMRYRPLHDPGSDDDPLDLNQSIASAIDELQKEAPGDVLVFLPGEAEIREASKALRSVRDRLDILPLYARLPPAEQKRIFHPGGQTRVILATNVAETSLTVPGIRYVIDTGQARISRYSWRSKVQRLKIEKISQASANQRAGRCGRTGPGICIRLYDEDDFNNRQAFTDPEILRTNLAAVILQMMSIRLGDIEQFPFIDMPDARLIKDGFRLLTELQAIDDRRNLNTTGKKLARLPIDPRLGRMLLAAEKTGAVTEVLAITTALAAQDPRERPQNKQQAADEKHARFRDKESDFIALFKLWEYLEEQSEKLSHNAMRKLCQKEFINHRRWREWHNLHRQLTLALKKLKIRMNQEPADFTGIHRALLSGLLDQIGFKDKKFEYLACRNQRFFVFPGSGLHKKPPKWVMAAEITETTKVFARMIAGIQPQWLEQTGQHLIKHHYSEPHWQKRRARVGGYEKLTLCGLVINPRRNINYAAVDPKVSREIFIRHALVYGEWESNLAVIQKNRLLIEEVENLEARTRRRDILIDEQELFDFYDGILPADIHSGVSFERWYKRLENLERLELDEKKLIREDAGKLSADNMPELWQQDGLQLPLVYHFEPGSEQDGVTLKIPLAILSQINEDKTAWLVPGLLEEKVLALIRGLPKALRKQFVPAPDFARAATGRLKSGDHNLLTELGKTLHQITGFEVRKSDWNPEKLPPHLKMRFEVINGKGVAIASRRDLDLIKSGLEGRIKEKPVTKKQQTFEREDIDDWDFGVLPESIEIEQSGYTLRHYPALTKEGDKIALRLFPTMEEAHREMAAGLRQLILKKLNRELRYLDKNLADMPQHCLLFRSLASCEVLKNDLYHSAVQSSFIEGKRFPHNRHEFDQLIENNVSDLVPEATRLSTLLKQLIPQWHAIFKQLKGNLPLNWIEAVADMKSQLDNLIYPGFLIATDREWLTELPRYLKAIQRRLIKLEQAPDRDRLNRIELEPLLERLLNIDANKIERDEKLNQYRWQLEELRVSLFAQELGTKKPVSAKRLDRLWKEIAE